MSQFVIGCIFVAAFVVSLLRGVSWAFVAVYLPSLILLNQLPEVPIPHAPLAAQFAPLYAILLAIPFRKESIKFKICSIDIIFVLLLLSATVTAWTTEIFETGINTLRTDFFTLIGPYLMARIVFKDWQMRRVTLWVMIGVLAVMSVAALIEFRLVPYFYLHVLQAMGMGNSIMEMAYSRYGFYRVSGPVGHPIYFGNMCLVILGMIPVLARTSGVKLSNPWVMVAIFAAVGCIVTSISFTPCVGAIAGSIYLLTLITIPFSRKLVLPLTLAVITVLSAYTYRAAVMPLGEKPDGDLPGSLYTRNKIIHESWQKVKVAGPFGLGLRADFNDVDTDTDEESFDLKSVDNTYMQFAMTHGWVYTSLWISIAVFYSWRVTRAFNDVIHPSQVFPLAVCAATVLGLMVSMFTVWADALYTVIWVVMLGLSNTLIDSVHETAARARQSQQSKTNRPLLRPPVVQVGGYEPSFAGRSAMRIAESR